MKLVGGPFADKAILRDAQSDKPFLLFIVSKDRLAIDERYLLDASDYIGDFSGGKVYACYPGRIAANDKKYRDIVNAILPYMHSADTCIGSNANFYLDHLDGSSAAHLFGPGAANAIKRDDSVIAMIPVQQAKDSEVYELSCWFLLRKEDYASPNMNLHFLDATGKDIGETYLVTKWSVDSKDLWFRSAAYFYMPAGCRSIKCILLNVPNPAYVALDELLLRPAGALVVSKGSDGSVMANNHLFRYLSNDNKQ